MRTITYNLRAKGPDSSNYYYEISRFTDEILAEAENLFRPLVKLFMHYIADSGIETLRTENEYAYELISLGIYWRIYGAKSLKVNKATARLLVSLYRLRKKYKSLKPYVDPLRGRLSTLFLSDDNNSNELNCLRPGRKDIEKLLLYLEATGEFNEEVKRLEKWNDYLLIDSPVDKDKYVQKLIDFAAWFELKSKLVLSPFTHEVENFRMTELAEHKWNEDYIFCARREVEYHLSMFGAEVMNRAFRCDFLNTSRKALLLPACMRINNGIGCRAKQHSLDMTCTGCNKNCRINQLTNLGKENNFEVHIIPHSSSFTKWLETWGAKKGIGVIGVACPLNLITGGLEMKALDIAAQCVLLDYCGCTNHWDKNGIATDIDQDELLKMLTDESQDIPIAI
ncbi:MAG: DUF116 domain-containing protein [Bacillota bacterium]